MDISKYRKICIYFLAIFLIFNSIVVFDCSNNEKIEKEIKISKNKEKQLEQEGQNYRLVTSADNVQVPVPKGYVASGIEGENYVTPEYSHTTITYKVSTTPTELTWSSPEAEEYPWTQDENGIWISGNQGIPNSESVLESEEFEYIKGTTLSINYTCSSQVGDYLNIYLIDLTNNVDQGVVFNCFENTYTSFDYTTSNYTYTMNNWATGRYKIKAIYSKNSSKDGGRDSGYIKGATYFKEDENGETIEIDQKTKIHDGGFVIYQLTDEEIETDSKGTNIIINETNKDKSQCERNQYVWVPVENIEDIVRTKKENNGIMQFGQEYRFSNTLIKKETSTRTEYYKEPRLCETDRTKHYMQRFSNLSKRENYLNEQQEDFKKMIKSIKKYKGFYIGRYETGDNYEHSSRKGCFINPKVVRYNSNINYVTWYDSYKDLKRVSRKTGKYVETGMLYGSLLDYTLKWLNETDTRSYEEITVDSGTWGNYSNNTKIAQSGEAQPVRTGAIEKIIYNGETYSDSPTAGNNIFDIAGNVSEWTRSCEVKVRMVHGGHYETRSDVYPGDHKGGNKPYYSGGLGVRGLLYIL